MTLTAKQFSQLTTKKDFDRLEKNQNDLRGDVKDLISVIENFTKKVSDFEIEMAANQGAHGRYEGRIEDLERKVDKLMPLFKRKK